MLVREEGVGMNASEREEGIGRNISEREEGYRYKC